jgi:integrase/recombinase XerD
MANARPGDIFTKGTRPDPRAVYFGDNLRRLMGGHSGWRQAARGWGAAAMTRYNHNPQPEGIEHTATKTRRDPAPRLKNAPVAQGIERALHSVPLDSLTSQHGIATVQHGRLAGVDANHLAAYWGHQQRRGRSPNTRVKYDCFLVPFAEWAAARGGFGAVTARDLDFGWLAEWHEAFSARYGRQPAPKTIANHITALRSLYDFLERYEMVERNPARQLEVPKIPPRVNDWLRPAEDDALLIACRSPQERIVVPLLRFAGLRGGEARALAKRDVDLAAGKITVRFSKTPRGRRVVPILPELRPYLERWLVYQHAFGLDGVTTPFLATRNGTAMRHKQVYDTVRRVAARAEIRPVSPHTLRRTFGSSLFNSGVRLEVVSRLLGHESTVTTERAYASLLDERIAEEVLSVC